MAERVFAPKCAKCRQREMAIATFPYTAEIDHDGRAYTVAMASLSAPKCNNCGNFVFDDEASKQISAAFRQQVGLLSPEEIRSGRERLGLPTQQAFAEEFGVSVSTISRWESGAQIQQRVMDDFLRAFFAIPELRAFLKKRHGVLPDAGSIPSPNPVATSVFASETAT